jgi:thiol:disulfide interchange protein
MFTVIMKKLLSLLLIAFIPFVAILAQETPAPQSPVQWSIKSVKKGEKSYDLVVDLTIKEGWHVYATELVEDGVAAIALKWDNENITKEGETKGAQAGKTLQDPIFNKQVNAYTGTVQVTQTIQIANTIPSEIKVTLIGFAASAPDQFLPVEETKTVSLEGGVDLSKNLENIIKLETIDLDNPVLQVGDKSFDQESLFTIFLLGFVGGLIALLTPCVFPMIPVTVSFFTNRSKTRGQAIRNGILYGLFILLIYALASGPFHLLDNVQPEIFNNIATNAWMNIFFFIVFIIFAISFFGYFELTLPSSIAGKADSKSSTASISGIFFMALTLVIVSFSCTGVILGSLLVGKASGGAWALTAGMSGFGVALGLPFALFAMFPNWLKSLPKSGGWLDTVKKILAFVEVALAFKFLSNADLVEHWGILKREVFIGIWIITALGLAAYLFGWLKLPHDHSGAKISPVRKVLGVVALAFAIYLVPGVTQSKYANLKLLSGFPPPLSYSVYGKDNVHGKGIEPKVLNSYIKALQLSKEQGKPILIDFTGWACVNCRKMEEQVWPNPAISEIINDKYILVSLYVDDRKKLPEDQRFIYKYADGREKEINTVGDKWATFQSENFNQVTQPLYVALDGNGKLLTYPVGYTPDISEYKKWLEAGIEAYNKTKAETAAK